MRPTRHYVAAEDIRWTLKLSSRRIITANHSFAKSREQDISVDIYNKTNNTYRNELVQEKYKDQKRITFPSGEKIPYFFLRTVRKL